MAPLTRYDDGRYKCPQCTSSFKQLKDLYHHVRRVHKRPFSIQCPDCSKVFDTYTDYEKHKCTILICKFCDSKHTTQAAFNKHLKHCIKLQNLTVPRPATEFVNDPLQPDASVLASLNADERERAKYEDNWLSLRTHAREGPKIRSYTFRWLTQANPDWRDWFRKVFARQDGRFRINIAHSSILYNSQFDDYKFFHASHNNENIWKNPKLIKNWQDMEAVIEELENFDVLEQVFRQRHDTKSVVRRLCSTSIFIWLLPSHPLGACCLDEFPSSKVLKNKK